MSDQSDVDHWLLERIGEYERFSGRISETGRYIAYGLVIWVFALISSSSPNAVALLKEYKFFVGWAGGLGALSLLLDYGQNLASYHASLDAMSPESRDHKYNKNHGGYFLAGFLFKAKQWVLLVGVASAAISFVGFFVLSNSIG